MGKLLKRVAAVAVPALAAGVAKAAVQLVSENTTVQVQPVVLPLKGLPEAFAGYRAVMVSDVHLPRNERFIRRLLSLVAAQKPDAVWIVGDLVNRHDRFDAAGLKALAEGLAAIAPCYAVTGNHERQTRECEQRYARILHRAGITLLRDESVAVEKDGEQFTLYGVSARVPKKQPDALPRPIVALAHHPEYAEAYAAAGFAAAISGHAHGGQVRIGGQGLYAPGQGLLPQYTSGSYCVGDMTLFVGRGLGNGTCPVRVGNSLHLPVIFLSNAE